MRIKFLRILSLLCLSLFVASCVNQEIDTVTGTNKELDTANTLSLVTGITGNQGGGVAAGLINSGVAIRGLTRNVDSERAQYWREQGVEMVQGDFTDHTSIEAALIGVDYLFINLQERIPDYIEETKFLLDAANRAGVSHIIYSSNRRSEPELPQSASKTDIELYLRSSGYSYTTVRFPQMMSNFIRERDMVNVLRNGVVGRGSADATFAYFSPDDLGYIAAAAFADPQAWNGREINLAGDEITDEDLAALLSELSGLDIKYTAPPAQPEARWLANQGLNYDTAQLKTEFPAMMNLREYLVAKDYGANLKEMSTKPLPPEENQGGQMGGNRPAR